MKVTDNIAIGYTSLPLVQVYRRRRFTVLYRDVFCIAWVHQKFFDLHTLSNKKTHLPYLWSPCICSEQIFNGMQFLISKIFLRKALITLVAHFITLHLVPSASKSVNYSSQNEPLKMHSGVNPSKSAGMGIKIHENIFLISY